MRRPEPLRRGGEAELRHVEVQGVAERPGYYEARTQGARRRNRARHQYYVAIRLRRFHAALFEGLRDRRHPVGVDLGFDLSVQHPLQSDLRDRRRPHRLGADDRVVRRRGVRRERAAILLCAGDLQ